MSKFSEKISDLFYDTTDFVLILLIICSVSGIIWWRLDGLFSEDDSGDSISNIPISENVDKSNQSDVSKDLIEEEKDKQKGVIAVTIPDGSLPDVIANILLENHVITDKFEFLKKSQEMELDTKMRSGKYEFDKDESVEDVIRKITKR